MTAAIYVRVSTGRQDEGNQLPDCLRLCEARGWPLPIEVRETASGAKVRPEWDRVMDLARKGVVTVIVIWSLDRIGRRMFEIIADAQELDRVGCALVSLREPWLDTSGPLRGLLLAIFAWVAQHERERLRERTIAGVARARAKGKILGRPRKFPAAALELAREMRTHGTSWRKISLALFEQGFGRRVKKGPLEPIPDRTIQSRVESWRDR